MLHNIVRIGGLLTVVAGISLVAVQAATAVGYRDAPSAGTIELRSDPTPARWTDVRPGDVLRWNVRVALSGADEGGLTLRLAGDGPLIDEGLHIRVDQCILDESRRRECGTPRTSVLTDRIADVDRSKRWHLHSIEPGRDVGLFVTLTIPRDAETTAERTSIGIGVTAFGDDTRGTDKSIPPDGQHVWSPAGKPPHDSVDAPVPREVPSTSDAGPAPSSPLARTGMSFLGPLLLGAGLMMIGTSSHLAGRKRVSTS